MTSPELEYHTTGVAVIEDALDWHVATMLASRSRRLVETHGISKRGIASQGGESCYQVLDGVVCRMELPELLGFYSGFRTFVEQVVHREIVLSPYLRSAINVKIYEGEETGQGWHYDTNPVSVVVYLTKDGGPTELDDLQGVRRQVVPAVGRALIMKGREVLHHVPTGNELRIVLVADYYHPTDMDRPDWIDAAVYENQSPPALAREA